MGIEVVPLTGATVVQALWIQRRHGLLTNESLLLATVLHYGCGCWRAPIAPRYESGRRARV
jgi:predicted nucleic acid-binding protein